MATTKTIPIVFRTSSDPVAAGFVTSLNRPGGNVTGNTKISRELMSKQLALLHEVIPTASKIGLLVNPNNPRVSQDSIEAAQAAARLLGLEIVVVHGGNESEIENAVAKAVQPPFGGLDPGLQPMAFPAAAVAVQAAYRCCLFCSRRKAAIMSSASLSQYDESSGSNTYFLKPPYHFTKPHAAPYLRSVSCRICVLPVVLGPTRSKRRYFLTRLAIGKLLSCNFTALSLGRKETGAKMTAKQSYLKRKVDRLKREIAELDESFYELERTATLPSTRRCWSANVTM
jgi:hypothetical protein